MVGEALHYLAMHFGPAPDLTEGERPQNPQAS